MSNHTRSRVLLSVVCITAILGALLAFTAAARTPSVGAASESRQTHPVLFFDDFEHGASRWSPQLGTWKICLPSDNPSHAYCASNNQSENLSIAGNASWNNYHVQSVIESASNDYSSFIGVLGRVQDRTHYYDLELNNAADGWQWALLLYNGATVKHLASGSFAWQANTPYVLQLDLSGNRLTAALSTNGGKTFSVLGSVTDSTYAQGKIGLWDQDLGYFDNVRVTQD